MSGLRDTDRFAVAAGELPLTARPFTEGVVAVVSGPAWTETVAASSAGVVLVAGEARATAAELRRLSRIAAPPVVLERPRLRPDLVLDAVQARGGAQVRLVVAECAADEGDLWVAVRDAIGWSRALVGPLVLSSSDAGRGGASALLLARDTGIAVTLRATVARFERPVLRVTAIGEVTTEVVVDDLGGRRSVTTDSAGGRRESPPRWETAERLALRRACEQVGGGNPPDVADLLADAELADLVLAVGSARGARA